MVLAFLLIGFITGLGASAAVLITGWGILAAVGAYMLGGMIGTLICILVSYPFGSDPGTPPAVNDRSKRAARKDHRLVPASVRIA